MVCFRIGFVFAWPGQAVKPTRALRRSRSGASDDDGLMCTQDRRKLAHGQWQLATTAWKWSLLNSDVLAESRCPLDRHPLDHRSNCTLRSTTRTVGLTDTFGLCQQYFFFRTNQPPATSQQYFYLTTNQHQPPAKRTCWSCPSLPFYSRRCRLITWNRMRFRFPGW
jgi:hypothetical protein